jgi:hypothetical protein
MGEKAFQERLEVAKCDVSIVGSFSDILCFAVVCVDRYSDWLRIGRSGHRIPVGSRFTVPGQTHAPVEWVPDLSRG